MYRALRACARYFFPLKANHYKPRFFTTRSVGIVLALIVLVELGLLAQSFILPRSERFLGAVLPGALVALSNDARSAEDLSSLRSNPLLDKAAALKAEDMARRGYFSHVTPEGKNPWIFFDAVGYDYSYAGENLAVNFTDSADVTEAWLLSPTHRANLLNSHFSEIGIGVAEGVYEGKNAVFVVQFLAAPGDSPPLRTTELVSEKKSDARTTLSSPGTPEVKALQAAPLPLWERIASSPRLLSEVVTLILLLFVTSLFAVAVVIRLQVQHAEVWSNGLLVASVLIGFLLLQGSLFPRGAHIPESAASVYSGIAR